MGEITPILLFLRQQDYSSKNLAIKFCLISNFLLLTSSNSFSISNFKLFLISSNILVSVSPYVAVPASASLITAWQVLLSGSRIFKIANNSPKLFNSIQNLLFLSTLSILQ